MPRYHPVFIGGQARSGTTLLVDILGLHPVLSPIYETNFLIRILKTVSGNAWLSHLWWPWKINRIMREACRLLPSTSADPGKRGKNERFFHGPDHVLLEPKFVMQETGKLVRRIGSGKRDAALRDFITALFAEHCRQAGKPAWVNKTPRNINFWPQLHAAFPEMRLIHIVRDGRDAACSSMLRWGPRSVVDVATSWAETVRTGRAFAARRPGQYMEVRYETLLQHPVGELNRILVWLDVEPCAETLLRSYNDAGFDIDPSRVGNWRKDFSDQADEEFQRIAGDLLGQVGYDEPVL